MKRPYQSLGYLLAGFTCSSGQTARPTTNMTNMDVLKRLSNLERHVFGAQLNDDDDRSNRF